VGGRWKRNTEPSLYLPKDCCFGCWFLTECRYKVGAKPCNGDGSHAWRAYKRAMVQSGYDDDSVPGDELRGI
jgi:hypothetical protein